MINKLKLGSKIQIISGEYKGLIGTILYNFKKKNIVNIDTIPLRIKFVKNKNISKKIELKPFIHYSNIKLYKNKLS
jgi:ribosomal protein L24